jgi:hypothetical protein
VTRFDLADDRCVCIERCADRICGERRASGVQRRLCIAARDDHAIADAHIERPMRFFQAQFCVAKDQTRDGRHAPGRAIEARGQMCG